MAEEDKHFTGAYGSVKIGVGEDEVLGVTDWTADAKVEVKDSTDMQSDRHKEVIAGNKEWTASFSFWIHKDQDPCASAGLNLNEGEYIALELFLDDGIRSLSADSGMISGVKVTCPQKDETKIDVTVEGNSNLVKTIVTGAVPPPVANFTGTPRTGEAPLPVTFTDTSDPAGTSWEWDFENDGVVDSVLQNPTHIYAEAGDYAVRLKAKNAGGSSTKIKEDYITVSEPA
jgi:hypothetical protein